MARHLHFILVHASLKQPIPKQIETISQMTNSVSRAKPDDLPSTLRMCVVVSTPTAIRSAPHQRIQAATMRLNVSMFSPRVVRIRGDTTFLAFANVVVGAQPGLARFSVNAAF